MGSTRWHFKVLLDVDSQRLHVMGEAHPLLWGMFLQEFALFSFPHPSGEPRTNNSVIVTEQCGATAVLSYISFAKCLLVYYFLMT